MRHRFRTIALMLPLLLLPASSRADGFSATASVATCELPGSGGFPLGPFACPVGGTLAGSMTAQASETTVGSNGGRSTVTGNAVVNGSSLLANAQISTPGNGLNAGNSTYSGGAGAAWNDTLTLLAGGTPAAAQLGISLIPAFDPSLELASNFPLASNAFAELSYSMSLFVSDPSLVPPGMDPGGGSVSCADFLFFGSGGAVQSRSNACLPLDSFVLNGLPYSLQMSLTAWVVGEGFDQNVLASDPFTLSLIPLQSGVQVLSASGVSYATTPAPVPEPSSLCLIALALSCLGSSWGRKLVARKIDPRGGL